jgi:hypothetical protein
MKREWSALISMSPAQNSDRLMPFSKKSLTSFKSTSLTLYSQRRSWAHKRGGEEPEKLQSLKEKGVLTEAEFWLRKED